MKARKGDIVLARPMGRGIERYGRVLKPKTKDHSAYVEVYGFDNINKQETINLYCEIKKVFPKKEGEKILLMEALQ